jgi:stage II sporulation protein AA (anti-sigma F factor antagonist)
MMELEKSALLDVPVLRVTGDLDHSNSEMVGEAIRQLGTSRVLIDLTGCPYLDSGGLSIVLSTVRDVRGKGWLGVVGSSDNVIRLFEIVGLTTDPDFRIFSNMDEASAALSREAD